MDNSSRDVLADAITDIAGDGARFGPREAIGDNPVTALGDAAIFYARFNEPAEVETRDGGQDVHRVFYIKPGTSAKNARTLLSLALGDMTKALQTSLRGADFPERGLVIGEHGAVVVRCSRSYDLKDSAKKVAWAYAEPLGLDSGRGLYTKSSAKTRVTNEGVAKMMAKLAVELVVEGGEK